MNNKGQFSLVYVIILGIIIVGGLFLLSALNTFVGGSSINMFQFVGSTAMWGFAVIGLTAVIAFFVNQQFGIFGQQ